MAVLKVTKVPNFLYHQMASSHPQHKPHLGDVTVFILNKMKQPHLNNEPQRQHAKIFFLHKS